MNDLPYFAFLMTLKKSLNTSLHKMARKFYFLSIYINENITLKGHTIISASAISHPAI